MGNISPATSDPLYSVLGLAASAPSSSSQSSQPSTNSLGPAVSVELAALQLQGAAMNTLLAGFSAANDPSSLFAGGSALSMLNAQGSAAMAYLLPQTPPAGQNVNALA